MEEKYDFPSKSIDYSAEFDIFAKKPQKIVITGSGKVNKLENGFNVLADISVTSKGFDLELKASEEINLQPNDIRYVYKSGLNFDKKKTECEMVAKINTKEAELMLKVFNKLLVHIDSKLKLSKQNQVIDTETSVIGYKPLVSHFEVKDLNTMIFTLAKKSTPNNKLQVSSGFILGQIADFRAEILKGNAKNDLVHTSLKLDDANFMKPDFGFNVENMQKMLFVSVL